jgi:AcrR family transcriptional regulator
MIERPYHHGGLRNALLARAEQTLRDSGVEGLSLRELARDIGVSHAAPHRHFRDRNALLDALATNGFRRLRETLDEAAEGRHERFEVTLTEVAVAYVRFATDNPALLALMFTSKHEADASVELKAAADASFARLAAVVEQGQRAGELVAGSLDSIGIVLFATLQGITSLANTHMIETDDLEPTTAYAVHALLHGLSPARNDKRPLNRSSGGAALVAPKGFEPSLPP